MLFQITVAEIIVEIHTVFKFSFIYCREFLSNEDTVDFCIDINFDEIDSYVKENYSDLSNYNDKQKLYVYGHLEYLILLRKISDQIPLYSTILMHGALISDGVNGFLITAPSGTGKTTRANYLTNNIYGASIVNGDKPFIKINSDIIKGFGTPWRGKENIGNNSSVTLKAILLLERSNITNIREISFDESFSYLVSQTHFPSSINSQKIVMNLLLQLGRHVKFYKYSSTSDIEDILFAYDYIKSHAF